jgi:hypothetical protein
MPPINLVPELGEHFLVVGETQEGKTYLTAGLLNQFSETYPCVVFDTKGEGRFDPWVDTNDWDVVRDRLSQPARYKRTVYRPEGSDLNAESLDSCLLDVYDSNFTGAVLLNEMEHVAPNNVSMPGLRYCLISGSRRRKTAPDGSRYLVRLGIWMEAHRPTFIPNYCKSEPKSYALFGVADQDLRTMQPYMRDQLLVRPDPRHFYFYRKGWPAPRLLPPVKSRGGAIE